MCYIDFILLEDCPSTGFCCDLEPSFFFWYREADAITEGGFLYQCGCPAQERRFYSVFRVSPVPVSQKLNQLITIFLPESPILEWHIVLHFQSILFLYFWNVLKNLQEIKHKTNKKKTTIESSWQRSTELFLEKQLLLALSLSGGCGRREQNTENTGLAVRTLSLRDQVGHLRVTWPQAHRVPSSAPRPLSVKIPALPPSEDSWDN